MRNRNPVIGLQMLAPNCRHAAPFYSRTATDCICGTFSRTRDTVMNPLASFVLYARPHDLATKIVVPDDASPGPWIQALVRHQSFLRIIRAYDSSERQFGFESNERVREQLWGLWQMAGVRRFGYLGKSIKPTYESWFHDYEDMLNLLFDWFITYDERRCALLTAIMHSKLRKVQILVDAYPSLAKGSEDFMACHCYSDSVAPFFEILAKHGMDVHYEHDFMLREASRDGNCKTIQALIDAGADVHVDGDEPLILAVKNSRHDAVKVLLENGARVNAQEEKPIRIANRQRDLDMARLLVKHGADDKFMNWRAARTAKKYREMYYIPSGPLG